MSENPWKNFPKDKPLKSGLYRVEYDCADHHWYQCWYWDEDAWVEENFRGCLIHLHHKKNIRFKPWNDEATVEPKVVLTIDEAKEIIGTYIATNCEIVKQHGIPELKIKNPNWLIHLLERIEQAEGE